LKEEFPLEDTWVSYEIHPETPAGGVRLERLFGPGYREMQSGIALRCRELGLSFQPSEVLSNSRLAVEAAEFARDAGKHDVFHRAVLAAYFAQSLDIGDAEVLRGLAEEIGLDGAALAGELAAGRYSGRRASASAEAAKLAVTGVPTFIFDGRTRVVGAQPLDYFWRLLKANPVGADG
jgi:predicted DsbA family dithiol-disulfide isomerase